MQVLLKGNDIASAIIINGIAMKKIVKALAVTAGVGAAAYLTCDLVSNLVVNRSFVMPDGISKKISKTDLSYLDELRESYLQWIEDYGYEKHRIFADDGTELIGYHMKPEKPSNVYAFLAHGYRSYGKREFCGIAQYYLSRGYNVFFVDHRASGESEGKYIGFGYYESQDCLKWLDYLNDTFGKDIDLIVHGVSMGSATVMLMSGSEKLPSNVKMFVADCGYTSAVDEFAGKLKEMHIPATPVIKVVNELNKRKAGYDFYDIRPIDAVRKTQVPFLFVHGDEDKFVPTYMAQQLYDACSSEIKDILIVHGAIHAVSFVTERDRYEAKLDEMISKVL